jgi:hypothetical protein
MRLWQCSSSTTRHRLTKPNNSNNINVIKKNINYNNSKQDNKNLLQTFLSIYRKRNKPKQTGSHARARKKELGVTLQKII